MDDGHVIFLVFTGVVGVLWIGANDVRTDQMTAGTLVQFLIYSIMVAGGVAASLKSGGIAAGRRGNRTLG